VKTAPPFDAEARRATAQWLALWARNGRELDARRVEDLRMLTDASAARIAVDVVWPMAPLAPGDAGEGLRPIREVLTRLHGTR
jgi:hypothetical protein